MELADKNERFECAKSAFSSSTSSGVSIADKKPEKVKRAIYRDSAGKVQIDVEALQRRAKELKDGDYRNHILELKENAANKLKDPEMAQFRKLFLSNENGQEGKVFNLCGEINGRNSYGGFVGFRRFISSGIGELVMIDDEKETSILKLMWPESCNIKVKDVD